MLRTLFTTSAVIAATAAHATAPVAPTATLAGDDIFAEYTGAGPVGSGNLDVDGVLWWVHETSFLWNGRVVDSWFIFFDPENDRVQGVVTFPGVVLAGYGSQAGLAETAGFAKPGLAYDLRNRFVGLEQHDAEATSFAGATMVFSWNATDPGDHVRVLTAQVPEPASAALLLAGLALGGFCSVAQARRQRQ